MTVVYEEASCDGCDTDDHLRGTKYADWIITWGGRDLIETYAGNDRIELTWYPDTVHAGRGNDTIDARNGSIDKIDCGPGRDVVRAEPNDKYGSDCEVIKS